MSLVDKAKNTVEKTIGEVKEKVGEATGNDDLQTQGATDQVKGSLKNAGENIKDAIKP